MSTSRRRRRLPWRESPLSSSSAHSSAAGPSVAPRWRARSKQISSVTAASNGPRDCLIELQRASLVMWYCDRPRFVSARAEVLTLTWGLLAGRAPARSGWPRGWRPVPFHNAKKFGQLNHPGSRPDRILTGCSNCRCQQEPHRREARPPECATALPSHSKPVVMASQRKDHVGRPSTPRQSCAAPRVRPTRCCSAS